MNNDLLTDKVVGCIAGACIGDTMGLSAECQSPDDIINHFGYIDTMVSNEFHKYPSVASRPPGTISDDSQLTLAMMYALSIGYDISIIKQAHVAAWQGQWGKPVGWGGSTKLAVVAMQEGNYYKPSSTCAGNGSAMKIAPLAIYSIARCRATPHKRFTNSFNASLLKKVKEITLLTHGDYRCVVATYCQARMIIRAIQQELPLESEKLAQIFITDAEYAESKLNIEWPLPDSDNLQDGKLSTRLKSILLIKHQIDGIQNPPISQFDLDTSIISKRICTHQSSYIMNSYPLVAYCVCKYLKYRNFMKAITETINAGADADSNGAMVASIVGGYLGMHQIPMAVFRKIRGHNRIMSQIDSFWELVQ